jgi:hypothetical protein
VSHSCEIALAGSRRLRSTLVAAPVLFAHAVFTEINSSRIISPAKNLYCIACFCCAPGAGAASNGCQTCTGALLGNSSTVPHCKFNVCSGATRVETLLVQLVAFMNGRSCMNACHSMAWLAFLQQVLMYCCFSCFAGLQSICKSAFERRILESGGVLKCAAL